MPQRNLGEAAVPQPWFAGLRRAVRSAPRTAGEDAATAVTLRALIGSRLIVWGFGLAALAIFGKNAVSVGLNDPSRLTQPFHTASANFLAAPAARWDSAWYLAVAGHGYFSRPSSAFFPLYPLMMHAGGALFGSDLVVGALISLASMTVAMYLLYLLTRLDLGDNVARMTVLLLAFFPTAFFLSAVYTEALSLMLSVGAIYAARQDRWAVAGLLAALASATHVNGVLLAVPLVMIYLYGPRRVPAAGRPSQWWRPRYRLAPSALWLLLVPLGLIAYLAYLWIAHNAPFAPFQVQGMYWRRELVGPFGAIVTLALRLPHDLQLIFSGRTIPVMPGDPISWNTHDLIDVGFLAFALAGLAFSWRRVSPAIFVYGLVYVGYALSNPTKTEALQGFPRYLLLAFPVFMGWAAKLSDKPVARRTTLVLCTGLLAGFSGLWACWGWIA